MGLTPLIRAVPTMNGVLEHPSPTPLENRPDMTIFHHHHHHPREPSILEHKLDSPLQRSSISNNSFSTTAFIMPHRNDHDPSPKRMPKGCNFFTSFVDSERVTLVEPVP
ncbi:hypothetical protein M408DRAFT_296269 [Serendipita vermifera MAFF 305830]|uniref:Uncharacterized protein n=1 Tax=Serendipita vermifera MAFF 305830 TaxID=933852 RepID=A0A0C2WVU6_SERVB|nr:hypothetical protein M408DRAFT_296269 [Serendipita vermifera MAFF 305830]